MPLPGGEPSMSLFRRRRRSAKTDQTEENAKTAETDPVQPVEPRTPRLGASMDEPEWGEIKDKVQAEVCAILARTILELIQSSQARTDSMDELVRQQAVNRLYADVLYDVRSMTGSQSVDPADKVLAWSREAIENWGRSLDD